MHTSLDTWTCTYSIPQLRSPHITLSCFDFCCYPGHCKPRKLPRGRRTGSGSFQQAGACSRAAPGKPECHQSPLLHALCSHAAQPHKINKYIKNQGCYFGAANFLVEQNDAQNRPFHSVGQNLTRMDKPTNCILQQL